MSPTGGHNLPTMCENTMSNQKHMRQTIRSEQTENPLFTVYDSDIDVCVVYDREGKKARCLSAENAREFAAALEEAADLVEERRDE
ncbi:hypothetical protein M193_gp094 [Halorubrum tailed phage 7]|uniref:hypothetical protein n=1 Tax=Halorubrum tailed phage 7 TaxID=2847108 RepID=UPI0003348FA6|nr:hypothetical protein M193_gp094 [Halorubrum tailed phage 7]AGM10951.1 hypothetical protein HRTV7_80 [Halorubrum tailed phage 7]